MAAETIACPYCNATVPLPPSRPTGERIYCPRCQERIPLRGGEAASADQEPAAVRQTDDALGHEPSVPSSPRWSNRSVALAILGIMGLMAAFGLVFAVVTTESRRLRDQAGPAATPETAPVRSHVPAQLAGLGYLPEGTEAIAGLHIAELLAQRDSQAILHLLRAHPTGFLRRIEQAMALKLETLDHLVLGLTMQEGVPHALLIAQTVDPYNFEQIKAALQASRPVEVREKTVYRIPPEQMPPGGVLWAAGTRTLVFALQAKDLNGVPNKPQPGLGRFPEAVQRRLTELPQGAQAWAVGAARWDELFALLQLLGWAEADRLGQVRAFSGRVHAGSTFTAHVDVTCTDAAGALALSQYLDTKGLTAEHLEQDAQKWPRAGALLQELARSLVRQRKDDHLSLELAVTATNLERALQPHD